jgi:hypothetical protein
MGATSALNPKSSGSCSTPTRRVACRANRKEIAEKAARERSSVGSRPAIVLAAAPRRRCSRKI